MGELTDISDFPTWLPRLNRSREEPQALQAFGESLNGFIGDVIQGFSRDISPRRITRPYPEMIDERTSKSARQLANCIIKQLGMRN